MNSMNVYFVSGGRRFRADELPELRLNFRHISSGMETAEIIELYLENHGSAPIPVSCVGLEFDTISLFGNPDDTLRFYMDGLTVVGIAGAAGKDDCDFALDPGFLRFTVSAPSEYHWDEKGVFHAEQVGVLRNMNTGDSMLAGFVTAKKFFCRIQADLLNRRWSAVVDTEKTVLAPGAKLALETLMLASGRCVEPLLCDYARETAIHMRTIPLRPKNPSGWCSYYYYYGKETETAILENARFLAEHRDDLPVEYIQIDDGWQRARGNYVESDPVKFPHGMKWLAEEITVLGFKPGIWVAPFLVAEDTDLFRNHPERLLRDRTGNLLHMGDCCFLDTSRPDSLEWLKEFFRTIRSWGYSYFKLDFTMVETCSGAEYSDRTATRVEAFRRGLEAIREAVGKDAFLLGGTSLLTPCVGLVDGCRISTDVTPFWCVPGFTPESPAIPNVCRNIINRAYMHGRLWLNDPDCLIVREYHNRKKYDHLPSLTLAESRMLATAMILSGGALFLGDRLAELPPERLEMIRKVFALSNGVPAWPVDRMESQIPRIWFRNGAGTRDFPHLLALFNWGESIARFCPGMSSLKLDSDGIYTGEDVWDGGHIAVSSRTPLSVSLGPHSCRFFKLYSGE